MTFISDIENTDATPAGLDWMETEKAAGGIGGSRKVLIDNILRADQLLNNTWLGKAALDSNSTGTGNVAIGENALTATTGDNNTAVGYGALDANVAGTGNVAVGKDAGGAQAGANDVDNVFIGRSAGVLANGGGAGGANVVIGGAAGPALTTGIDNVIIGFNGAQTIATGLRNIFIGHDTIASGAGINNEIVIGSTVTGGGEETFRWGISSDYVSNDFGQDANLAHSSDIRMKNILGDSPVGLSFINRLVPKVYTKKPVVEWPSEWDVDPSLPTKVGIEMEGLIAQDVKAAMDTEGITKFGGWSEDKTGRQFIATVAYVHPLINSVNEITKRLEVLERAHQ